MAKVGGAARPPRPAQRLVNSLTDNCFAARRQQVEASQLFQSRDLAGHSICAMEFSDDGTWLISGGYDRTQTEPHSRTKPHSGGLLIKAAMNGHRQ